MWKIFSSKSFWSFHHLKCKNYFLFLPEDPVFSTPGQSARLKKKLLPHKAFISSISFWKSFFTSRALCPGLLKTGSSGKNKKLQFQKYSNLSVFIPFIASPQHDSSFKKIGHCYKSGQITVNKTLLSEHKDL